MFLNRYNHFLSLFIFLILLLPAQVSAQFFEDFEQGNKTSFAGATVQLQTGNWFFDDALIGTDATRDAKNGSRSARIRNGSISMSFDKPDGADQVSFFLSNSGFSGDNGGAVQVEYSINSGATWVAAGDPIVAPVLAEFQQFSVPVNQSGNIRIRFVKTAGNRINIDDVRITNFVQVEEEPTLDVLENGFEVANPGLLDFLDVNVGTSKTRTLTLRNRGNQTLNLQNIEVTGTGFSIIGPDKLSLELMETTDLEVIFSPTEGGNATGSLAIASNAANAPNFSLNLSGNGISEGDIMSIATAREVPFGTRVTVAGRVTVGDEFGGPAVFQDGTAGLSAFWEPFHSTVSIGDSVIITGPITEFNPIGGTPGTFLRQIAEFQGDDNIVFQIFSDDPQPVSPAVITAAQMNAGGFESQLVEINNATINFSGSFQANTNYTFTDGTAEGVIRIDANSNLVGAQAPSGSVNMVGVVDRFNGVFQFKPRNNQDLGIELFSFPGEEISKDETFEIVTWNIEWFGAANQGPSDDNLQLENVKTVINTIDADVYALQEISDFARFQQLVNELDAYGGFIAGFGTQQQQTAFLFKRSTIDSVSSRLVTEGMTQSDWANGRFPLEFRFNATINGQEREMYAYNIHAKALSDADSYQQRINASAQLKQFLDTNRPQDKVIVIGDFNDELDVSTFNSLPSPYQNFDSDPEYRFVTRSLVDRGFFSFSSVSFIDHIVLTSELDEEFFEGTERVENPFYIGSFLSTTSDHFPVWVRMSFDPAVSIEDDFMGLPTEVSLSQNYPNPFNPNTQILFNLPQSQAVSLDVYDVMGRKVATLFQNTVRPAGENSVTFDASNLSSGMYIYRLTLQNGNQLAKTMLLLK